MSFACRVSDTPDLVIRMSAKLQETGRYSPVPVVTAPRRKPPLTWTDAHSAARDGTPRSRVQVPPPAPTVHGGFTRLELGYDVPAITFAAAPEQLDFVAVGIGVTGSRASTPWSRRSTQCAQPSQMTPVILGGQGVRKHRSTQMLGASAWAPSGAGGGGARARARPRR